MSNSTELADSCINANSYNGDWSECWASSESAIEHDCVLVAEFSEVHGPQVLHCVPSHLGTHFQQADFALWLMSSDYQCGQKTANVFTVPSDVQSVLRNEEFGVVSLTHHFTLFDVEARGFVRAVCVSYVSANERKVMQQSEHVLAALQSAVNLIKNCNRRLFLAQMGRAIEALGCVQNETVCAYYELYFDNNCLAAGRTASGADDSVTEQERDRALIARARKLLCELQLCSQAVTDHHQTQSPSTSTSAHECVTDHNANDHTPVWLHLMLHGKQCTLTGSERELRVLADLYPCVNSMFCQQLRVIWSQYNRTSYIHSFLELHPTNNHLNIDQNDDVVNCMELFMDGFALLSVSAPDHQQHTIDNYKLMDNKSTSSNDAMNTSINSSANSQSQSFQDYLPSESDQNINDTADNTKMLTDAVPRLNLRNATVLGHLLRVLPEVLGALWTGHFVLVCGGCERRHTVCSVVHSIRRLVPHARDRVARCVPWCTSPVSVRGQCAVLPPSMLADYNVCGHQLSAHHSPQSLLSPAVQPFVATLDLNNRTVRAPALHSKLLKQLKKKSSAQFVSDECLLAYVRTVLGQVALLSYVLYQTMYCSEHSTPQSVLSVCDQLQLWEGDRALVQHLVELVHDVSEQSDQSAACSLPSQHSLTLTDSTFQFV